MLFSKTTPRPRRLPWLGAAVLAGGLGGLGACSLPAPVQPPQATQAIAPEVSAQTALGQAHAALRQQAQAPTTHSGVYALDDPREAFAARSLLARAAQHTLDVQYYIWRHDKTGLLLLHELLLAADRGVRVRLLLDDGGTTGLDDALQALHSHPNAEVRLVNPLPLRGWLKPLGYVTDFRRTHRRMHNKSFSADGQASIVGGRNVGNEYFGATDGVVFADLDVLAIGPAVLAIEQDFDRYWNHVAAYPVDQVAHPVAPGALEGLRRSGQALVQSPAAQDYRQALEAPPFVQHLLQAQLPMDWAVAHLVSDPPEKILGQAPSTALIGEQLRRAIGTPTQSLDLVSPYFVPTAAGVQAFAQLRAQGLRVRILTNAPGGDRRGHRALGLRQVPQALAASRHRAVRETRRTAGLCQGRRPAAPAADGPGQLRQQPACQDFRGRRAAGLCRLFQLRPALAAAQSRDGPDDREPAPGAADQPQL